MTRVVDPACSTSLRRNPLVALAKALRQYRRHRTLHRPDAALIKDASIAWELAGYGRGADISMLAVNLLQSQR